MLYEALQILANEVNIFFKQERMTLDDMVVLENIALLETEHESASDMKNKVVLTLLTIDEETTLRNFTNKRVANGHVEYANDKVNLNLYVLFSGNITRYQDSLRYISKVIEFFQGKSLFTQLNTSYDRLTSPFNLLENFRFTMELYTPTFEDLNYIWGTLGGKQYPSALYKLTLVTISRNQPVAEVPSINEIQGNTI